MNPHDFGTKIALRPAAAEDEEFLGNFVRAHAPRRWP